LQRNVGAAAVDITMYWDQYSGPEYQVYFKNDDSVKIAHLITRVWEIAKSDRTDFSTSKSTAYKGSVTMTGYNDFSTSAPGSQMNGNILFDPTQIAGTKNPGIGVSSGANGALATNETTNLSFQTGFFSDAYLPVQLINFTAKTTPEKKVALSWTTATESVNKGFRIERQTIDLGSKFENIGFVNSKAIGGNSQSNLYYSVLDNNPKPAAANHYRLVQEDLDGTLTYSEVRMIRLGTQSVSMIFPNPSSGGITISRTADDKKMNIQVIDLSGKVVKEINNISESYYKFNITQPGVYNIKMTYPETGEQSIQRVVVQR
jgi:hypothetical protein